MPYWVSRLFTALHVYGAFMWIGGLLALTLFLAAIKAEPDVAARTRLGKYARRIAMLPDIGATLAILFGLHSLFALKLYKAPYMHIKLTLVVVLIALHGLLRVKTKRAAEGADATLPGFVPALLSLVALGILAAVFIKLPL